MAGVTDDCEEGIDRARVHDASKFGTEERIAFVWLTEPVDEAVQPKEMILRTTVRTSRKPPRVGRTRNGLH
jgi:hypothetical protein